MIIRGRSDKQAHSVLQQYASHELPSVIVNNQKKNSMPPGQIHRARELSERSRRRLSNNVNSQQVPKNDSRAEQQRNSPLMVINKTNIQVPQNQNQAVSNSLKVRTGNSHREQRGEDFQIRQTTQLKVQGRFSQESPLGIVQSKFIPRKGAVSSMLPTQPGDGMGLPRNDNEKS